MKPDWQIKDSELETVETISKRISQIERARDTLESEGYKTNASQEFQLRHNKLAKMTARIDVLWLKRAKLLKEAQP